MTTSPWMDSVFPSLSMRAIALLQATPSELQAPADSLSSAATARVMEDSLSAVNAVGSAIPPADSGLSFTELLQSLPTDPASIFSLLLLVLCTILVLRYGLQNGGDRKKSEDGLKASKHGDSTGS